MIIYIYYIPKPFPHNETDTLIKMNRNMLSNSIINPNAK